MSDAGSEAMLPGREECRVPLIVDAAASEPDQIKGPRRSIAERAGDIGGKRESDVTLSLVADSTLSSVNSESTASKQQVSPALAHEEMQRGSPMDSSRKSADGQHTLSNVSDSKELDVSPSVLSPLRALRNSIAAPSSVVKLVRSYSAAKPAEPSTSDSSIAQRQRGAAGHSLVLGILMAAGASAVLSLVNVVIKRLESVSSLEVLTFMAFGVFIGILPTATEEAQPFGPSSAQPLLVVRTILSLGAAGLRLSSLSYLTIADSSIITSLTPLMVAVTASLFLAEPCHWTQGAAVALSILGITLVVKPPFLANTGIAFTKDQYIGIAYGLCHTVLNGVTTVCIRATKGVSRSVVVFHYGCLSMLLVSIVSIAVGRLKIFYDGSQIGYLLLISHLTFAVQMFLTKALQIENASVVTIVKTSSDVIFGFVMQAVFLNVYPDLFSLLGGTFVLVGVVIIGMRKIAQASAPDTMLRRRLRFLL
ncbi:solute carrier family 35 member G1-like [Dermacentor albipictus]|uniref:solute carrier family 35 member G1-like n=1 Tax=Dermacentor albipictus TaxID=60249 RepID=UPI0031FD6CB1